ncbi:PIN domain-containing protein [Plantactinospora sp. KLBMP9567]|uniref:PIN domain-containing protein n=1 Tax=Plantactinospora sp. KLBMP9567 TaxID=3085900 RepID=UPI00298119DB|nr:PIN domain-containing protein [Plantactinospora sp. KLBMP9567]MDW5322875.1 PIN domain-containing protein [Plantactinospora sp. KLBMP9567]
MLVTPLPGTNRQNLRQTLRQLHAAATNVRGGGAGHGEQVPIGSYFRWTDTAVGQLTGQVAERDIRRLVLTPRYWALLGSPNIGTPQFYAVLSREIDQRIAEFDAASRALESQIHRWADLATYIVPDTSFFCQGERLFDQADYHGILDVNWREPIRLLIPVAVVDELDDLKEARTEVRHRARVSLAILDRVVSGSPQDPHELRPPELRQLSPGFQVPTGQLTVEILLDSPGHVRLPIVDDEIIDRALAVQPLAAREVILLTCDTNQSFRARSVRLKAVKAPRKNQKAELEAAHKAEGQPPTKS